MGRVQMPFITRSTVSSHQVVTFPDLMTYHKTLVIQKSNILANHVKIGLLMHWLCGNESITSRVLNHYVKPQEHFTLLLFYFDRFIPLFVFYFNFDPFCVHFLCLFFVWFLYLYSGVVCLIVSILSLSLTSITLILGQPVHHSVYYHVI